MLETNACRIERTPMSSRMVQRDMPTDEGNPRKNELTRFPIPYANNSLVENVLNNQKTK